jgi:signal transduction histidine kinase/CheY-like chemotaxis protein
MTLPILTVAIHSEDDVVTARQRARQTARLLGFDRQDQTRVATAVSEITRNAFAYAEGGRVEFLVDEKSTPPLLLTRITDHGPGIENVRQVLAGQYRSTTGMGLGIIGAKRLMDLFQIESSPARGTTVLMGKHFPRGNATFAPTSLAAISNELAQLAPRTPLAELQQQNQELLRALDELHMRQEELTRLNAELEDTNRGVVALYAELDEKAEQLQRANELKTRFLSNMGHEFRTPVNSILALSRLLLERIDGELTEEQEKQISFIRQAAQDLSDLVNDLLDLAKVEAGKIAVRPDEFEVTDLFATLRGLLRPLVIPEVALVFDEPDGIPPLYTDEGKISQILRNFISNALKFTERGQVRVSATLDAARQTVVFAVADTGIGIALEDQDRIFEEFAQAEHPIQQRTKGTGLGLPLTRRLAELLGGSVNVRSAPGRGSVFSAIVPLVYAGPAQVSAEPERARPPTPVPVASGGNSAKILIVDDDEAARYVIRRFLAETFFTIIEASNGPEGLRRAREDRPRVIFLDLMMPQMSGFEVLEQLESDPVTRSIPVIIITSKLLKDRERRPLDGKAVAVLSKETASREAALASVRQAMAQARLTKDQLEGMSENV